MGKVEIFSLDFLVYMATSAYMAAGLIIRPQTSVKARAIAQIKDAATALQQLRADGGCP
jgi:hypothetical protein